MKIQSFRFRKVLQKIIDLFVVYLQKRTINIVTLTISILVILYLLEQPINCSWNESCVILIRDKILKKCILMLLWLKLFRYWTLPITSEHSISLSRPSLSVSKYCKIISFRYFWQIIPKEIKHIALSLIFSYRLIKFCFNHWNRVGRNLDCFTLNELKYTSYSTSAT